MTSPAAQPSTRIPAGTVLSPQDIADLIDHALLKPELTAAEVREGIEEVAAYDVWSVCVRPCDVVLAAQVLRGRHTKVGTVIGFPHGTTSTAAKVAEAQQAMRDGAVELDMVLNIGRLIGGQLDEVVADIRAVVQAAHDGGALLKVIIETALLDERAKLDACRAVTDGGADFIKTSTGFAGGGATIPDVALLAANVPEHVAVKASGGVRDLATALAMVGVGASRLGTSSSVELVTAARAAQHAAGAGTPGDREADPLRVPAAQDVLRAGVPTVVDGHATAVGGSGDGGGQPPVDQPNSY